MIALTIIFFAICGVYNVYCGFIVWPRGIFKAFNV